MNKKELLQNKLIELYKIDENTMTEQQKLINTEKIRKLLESDPLEFIHIGNMRNRLSLQKRKQGQLSQKKAGIDISDVIERLNNEVLILEELINLYEDIKK